VLEGAAKRNTNDQLDEEPERFLSQQRWSGRRAVAYASCIVMLMSHCRVTTAELVPSSSDVGLHRNAQVGLDFELLVLLFSSAACDSSVPPCPHILSLDVVDPNLFLWGRVVCYLTTVRDDTCAEAVGCA
jgi:hypothetical protein